MRAEVIVVSLCLSSAAWAQERSGPLFELGPPAFTAPREGVTEIGTSVLAEGTARPLVDVELFDARGALVAVVKADDGGRWAASVATPAGPTKLTARAHFLNVVSGPALVHFTMLRDDAIEGGGCSAASGVPLLLGLVLLCRRRRRRRGAR